MPETKPELTFAELKLGRRFRPLPFAITPELVARYLAVVGDHHPLYQQPAGQAIAPPGLAAVYARLSYLQDHTMPSGGVLAQQEFENQGLAKVGDVLEVQASVFEHYVDDRGHLRVSFLIQARNQADQPVCRVRLFAIWPK
ncbi:MAG: MaoC family dehydratase [Pseudomonadota bacterium]